MDRITEEEMQALMVRYCTLDVEEVLRRVNSNASLSPKEHPHYIYEGESK